MKFRFNEYVLAALLAASSVSQTSSLQVPSSQRTYRPVAASLLNMPETVNSSGGDEEKLPDDELSASTAPNSASNGVAGERNGKQFVKKNQKKPRNHNPAMGDTAFLRKRTARLLRITAKGYERGSGSNDILSGKMKIDKKTFNWLIDSWAFSGELDASDKAYALLSRMEELDHESSYYNTISPDVRSYTKVINAISRSGRADAGDMADKLMKRMETLYLSGRNVAAKPNTSTYTAVVEAHANSGVPGGPARSAEICEEMIQKWEEGDPDIRPTSRCFNAAINAYAKSGEEDAAQLAEGIFEQMMEVYEAGNEECKPNTYNYNAVICAFANSGEEGSAQRAQEILERMEAQCVAGDADARPTTVTFNTVIDAYAKSGEEDAEERAEGLLRHMEELFETGLNVAAKPNVRSFNTVINSYAKSGREDAALKAERVLDYMEKLYEAGNEDVRPDVHSFCTVINAWARSQKTGKAERAQNLFRSMQTLYEAGNDHLRPNVVAYNAVMNACAFTNGDVHESNRAVEIAHGVLRDLENSEFGTADQITYGTFLKVCSNQMAECDARDRIVDVLFKKCCREGQVGNMVLQQLKAVAKNDHYVRLTGRANWENLRMEELPADWWCNVVEGKYRRRKRLHDKQAGKTKK